MQGARRNPTQPRGWCDPMDAAAPRPRSEETMKNKLWILLVAAFAAACLAAGAAKASKVELPQAIRQAFEKAYPNATIKDVSTEKEDGETRYEVESIDGTTARDLIYRADGSVVEMEEVIPETDLPQPVRDAIAIKYPKGKLLKAERLTRGTTVLYEMQIKVGKKTRQLVLDPSGARVKAAAEAPEK
jgi:hypothetical protein